MGHRFIKFTGLWVLVFVARRGSLSISSENQPCLTLVLHHFTPVVGICYVHTTEVYLIINLSEVFFNDICYGEFMYPKVMKQKV